MSNNSTVRYFTLVQQVLTIKVSFTINDVLSSRVNNCFELTKFQEYLYGKKARADRCRLALVADHGSPATSERIPQPRFGLVSGVGGVATAVRVLSPLPALFGSRLRQHLRHRWRQRQSHRRRDPPPREHLRIQENTTKVMQCRRSVSFSYWSTRYRRNRRENVCGYVQGNHPPVY